MAEPDQPQQLKRSLTLWLAVLYGLGVTIGAGIYVLVGIAAGRSGMHAPLAFVFAARVMSLSAAAFAELGTRMPVSASEAAYVEKAFNRPWLSLTMGLLVVLTATISAATISVGSAGYLGVFEHHPDPHQVHRNRSASAGLRLSDVGARRGPCVIRGIAFAGSGCAVNP